MRKSTRWSVLGLALLALAGAEAADARFAKKSAFGEKAERLALPRRFDDLARVAGTLRGFVALDETGARAPHHEVSDRDIAHFALDDEREPRRQEALQQDAIDIAGVIGDHDAAALGQVLEAVHLRSYSGQQE